MSERSHAPRVARAALVPVRPPPVARAPARRREPVAAKAVAAGPIQVFPTLVVGSAHDPLEHEADRIAARVLAYHDAGTSTRTEGSTPNSSCVAVSNAAAPIVVRAGAAAGSLTIDHEPFITRVRGPPSGTQVPEEIRGRVEAVVGHDLSHVRIHDRAVDRSLAADVGARAFTYGTNVWLGPGESRHDVALLAHELAHVVQQGAATRHAGGDTWSRALPVPPAVQARLQRAEGESGGLLASVISKAREVLGDLAKGIPGFELITVILGRNPFTDTVVERTPTSLLSGILDLVPKGKETYENLKQSGAILAAFDWVNDQLTQQRLTWPAIKAVIDALWAAARQLDVSDFIGGIFGGGGKVAQLKQRAIATVADLFGRVKAFALAAIKKVLQLVFEGVIKMAGPVGIRVLEFVRKAGETIQLIVDDPVRFLKNLLDAVVRGVTQFGKRIWEHLKRGFFEWMFGALSNAGVRLPAKWDLRGILSFALDILGVSYSSLRAKLVKVVGEPAVHAIEQAVEFVVLIATKGLTAAWDKLAEWIGSLKESVIDAIQGWVVQTVVTTGLAKLAGLFLPVSAIIQAIEVIYRTVTFLIEKAQQIFEFVEGIANSIGRIARGDIGAAADAVEQTMARTIPLILNFLAGFVGLGSVSGKIREIVTKIRTAVDRAIDKAIAFVVSKAKALLDAGKKGIASFSKWWKQKRTIQVAGKTSTVFFSGSGPTAVAMVQSSPAGSIQDRLAQYTNSNKPKVREFYLQARKALDAIELAMKGPKPGPQPTTIDLTDLAAALKLLFEADALAGGDAGATIPETTIHPPAGDQEPGLAGLATARVSVKPKAGGGAPSSEGAVWNAVKARRNSLYYVRGHLISELFGGPGKFGNLTPISRSVNGLMNRNAERPIQLALMARPTAQIDYSVEPVYPKPYTRPAAVSQALDELAKPEVRQRYTPSLYSAVVDLLTHEWKLPKLLTITAFWVQPDGNKGERFKGVKSINDDRTVDTVGIGDVGKPAEVKRRLELGP